MFFSFIENLFGVLKLIDSPHIVVSQLKIFMPVSIAIIIGSSCKVSSRSVPKPTVYV